MILTSFKGKAFTASRRIVMAFLLSSVIGQSQAGGPAALSTLNSADNEAIVRKAFGEWGAGSGNVFGLLSHDVRWTIHGSGPVADTYIGIEDFTARGSAPLVSRLSTPLKPEVHHIWAIEDRVIIRFDASAITTGGNIYRNQFVWIFRMDTGMVVEAEAFLDLVAYQVVVDNNEPLPQ